MGVSREEVVWIYKVVLGREPENEDVIAFRVNSGISRREMITQVINSDEFAKKHIVE